MVSKALVIIVLHLDSRLLVYDNMQPATPHQAVTPHPRHWGIDMTSFIPSCYSTPCLSRIHMNMTSSTKQEVHNCCQS